MPSGSSLNLRCTRLSAGDLLIAAHLSLQLVRDCMELAMLLRDRAEGTRHHRHGAPTDADLLARVPAPRAYTAPEIIDAIQRCSALFDALAFQWEPNYRPKLPFLQPGIEAARAATER